MTNRRAKDESGFTLVELILTIVILGVIITPIALVFSITAKTTAATSSRASTSTGINTVNAYFGGDVQSASTVLRPAAVPCGGSGTALIEFRGTDQSDTTLGDITAESFSTVYALQTNPASEPGPDSASERRLVRLTCRVGATSALTEAVLAVPVASGTAVTCMPSDCGAAATKPTTVRLVVQAFPANQSNASDDSTYTARRRTS